MKIHKVVLTIIDFDNVGVDEIKEILEDTRYPNRCISPNVLGFETADIGEWDDDHPLNNMNTIDAELCKIFPSLKKCDWRIK